MCGRTALFLDRESIGQACCYKNSENTKFEKPKWIEEHNFGKSYSPGYNIAPTVVTPVLVNGKNFGISDQYECILKPMMWGMVPPWHKGDYKSHGLSTNNCRLESLKTSKLYAEALRWSQRCVVLAQGFIEWQTTEESGKSKQPYFVYMPQPENIKIENPESYNINYDEIMGYKGPMLLKMAGLYSTWCSTDGNLYSYSVITMNSNDTLSWLHSRMPAILETEAQVHQWLDTDTYGPEVLSILKPVKLLQWHPVSTLINNSRNNSIQCLRELKSTNNRSNDKIKTIKSSQKNMLQWLSQGKRTSNSDRDVKDVKKLKIL